MLPPVCRALLLAALSLWLLYPGIIHAEPKPLQFQLTFSPEVSRQPFTGRVYVVLSRQPIKELRSGPNWFTPEPFFARDVRDWQPDQPILLGKDVLGHPHSLEKLPAETYHIQAVMDFDRGHISFATAEGNGYSQPIKQELHPAKTGVVKLRIDQVYKPKPFQQTDRVKLVDVPSKLLSAFHGRPVQMKAGVVLPAGFNDKPQRKYPVIYEIPGFSGTHSGAFSAADRKATEVAGIDFLYVMLDPSCRLGHHVFADSENNGPCGRALIEELIPHIEKEYRGLGEPTGRFVTGHSSGGWSSLWLQITYPDFFGGVWSTSPDPVDFRDFQRIDLTRPDANMFIDDKGKPRPIARRAKTPLYYQEFSDMELVMGHGGQLGAFEAVFSPRGPDGKPRILWNRATGAIDPETARSWEKYDVRKILEKNWPTLGPKLSGKIHVYMGEEDTFYLEGATALLKRSLKALGSDAVVELFPNRTHGNLVDANLRKRIAQEMAGRYRRLQARAE